MRGSSEPPSGNRAQAASSLGRAHVLKLCEALDRRPLSPAPRQSRALPLRPMALSRSSRRLLLKIICISGASRSLSSWPKGFSISTASAAAAHYYYYYYYCCYYYYYYYYHHH